jgi:FkbM family methyltransferase
MSDIATVRRPTQIPRAAASASKQHCVDILPAVLEGPASRLRAAAYRGYTKLPVSRQTPQLAAAVQRVARRGPVRIEGGIAKGMVFAAEAVSARHVQVYGLVRGSLEVSVQEALRRTVAPGSIFYDVGANVGFFSLVAARLAGPTGVIHAFEPVPSNVDGLKATAVLNDVAIHEHDVAIADYVGRSSMSVPREGSWSHLIDHGTHPAAAATIEVKVTTLDAFVEQNEPPDVIKIDVEGYEVEVLQGATALLRTKRPAVVCELHGTRNSVAQELLDDAGYTIYNLEGTAPIADAGPTHILATPP